MNRRFAHQKRRRFGGVRHAIALWAERTGGWRVISYRRLWETMRERRITQYALIHTYHISPGQLTRLKRNESVSTHTIEVFCKILNCRVEDVMEYLPDE